MGDTSKLERSLKDARTSTQRLGGSMGQLRVGFGTVAKATAGVVGLTSAFSLLGDAVHAGISEFSEAAKANADLDAALKSTHGTANVTAGEIDALSTSLMNLSGVDDEVIKGGATMLLTFRNVRNEVGAGNDIFTQATKAALDLSVRFKTDLAGSAKQLGKALNDPARGLTALRRIGVSFSDAQAKQIKQWAQHGQILRAQKAILRELTIETGGTAKALGTTLAGRINIVRENAKNLAAEVIGVLTPSFERLVKRAEAWIQNADNQKRVVGAAKEAVRIFTGVLNTLKGALDDVNQITGSTKDTIKLFVGVWAAFKITALISNLGLVAGAVSGIGKQATVATGEVGVLRGALLGLPTLIPVTIAVAVEMHREQIQKALEGVPVSRIDRVGPFPIPTGAIAKVLGFKPFEALGLAGGKEKPPELPPGLTRGRAAGGLPGGMAAQVIAGLKKQSDDAQKIGPAADKAAAASKGVSQKLRNAWFDNEITRALTRVEGIRSIQGQISRLEEIRQLILKRAAATKDVTRANTLEDQAFQVWLQQRGLRDQLAQEAASKAEAAQQAMADAAEKAAAARDAATQKITDVFGLKLSRAELTKTLADDLAVLKAWEASTRQRMTVVGRTLELQQQLVDIQGRIAGVVQQEKDAVREAARAEREKAAAEREKARQAAEAAKEKAKAAAEAAKEKARAAAEAAKAAAEAARERAKAAAERARERTAAKQFGLLGFGPTGGERIPGVEALRGRLAQLQQKMAGTATPKIRQQILQIGKVLSGAFGKVGTDVRSKIDEIMDGWADALNEGSKKLDLTKFHRPTAFGAAGAHPAAVAAIAGGIISDAYYPGRGGRTPLWKLAGMTRPPIGPSTPPGLRAVPGGFVPAPITINGNVNLHGVQSVSELEQQLTKRQVGRAHLRRGAR